MYVIGLIAHLSARHETMTAFLSLLESKYGGVDNYIKGYCNLTNEDLRIIRNTILIPGDSRL